MKRLIVVRLLCSMAFSSCHSQEQDTSKDIVGGPCEGCEALYEYGEKELYPVDTLPGYDTSSYKLMVTGVVYQKDGEKPAADVIIYIYHTNAQGIYPKLPDSRGWEQRHGHIRGWVKTGPAGRYTFYTSRPGAYPGRSVPEHIHVTVKETNTIPYYLDDYTFADDPLLTENQIREFRNRGGNGRSQPRRESGHWIFERDLILGQNIPGYDH